jgi:phosphoribosylamine--glycine ligase
MAKDDVGAMPERMRVLLVGNGGREHALAEAIAKSPRCEKLWAANPGNPGIDALAEPVNVPANTREIYRLRQFCDANRVDFVVIGPEDPLADGWADELARSDKGVRRIVFGPTKKAAQIEADKAFSKQLMRGASIPTAEGRVFQDPERAKAFLESRDELYVVKAAGLAKGKGVIVPETPEEALRAVDDMMTRRVFGEAGRTIVIEEKLSGVEASVLALTDGKSVLVLPPCQDHKRLRDGDKGPNTGGMGAFCPTSSLDGATMATVEREILVPMLDALRREEIDFRGVLYAGLMLTHAGPRVLEFNARFGDPECQPLLARLESDLLELLWLTAAGRLDEADVRFRDEAAVTVVMASENYPEKPKTGDEITGLEEASRLEGVRVHLAGATERGGAIVTSGGRVLGVTGLGKTMAEARDRAYAGVDRIRFRGMQVRRDIAAGL